MPLKIMCAGCPKAEREPAEASVKAALGHVAGSWTVSLVKIGRQWSMTVDGPEVKHKTLMVPEGGIKQAIQELLSQAAPAPRAPAPPALAAPSTPAPRPSAPVPAFSPSPPAPVSARAPQPAAPASRAPLPPTRSAPAPTPRNAPTPPSRTPFAPPRPPSFPTKSGERQDRYACQFCGGAFLVIYEAGASASQETVAVACPHCWKNSHVMVSEEAALSRDYRSEKA